MCSRSVFCLLRSILMQATDIQSGMDIFGIPQPPYKELAHIEQELELLSKMWGVVAEWESVYDGWKTGHFKELKVYRGAASLVAVPHCLLLCQAAFSWSEGMLWCAHMPAQTP